ncbi:hypothetical protein CPC08DRAFT_559988 [Agrocybe pediades]|nr:hypothetical protein CPC08DRAFT_559988 [Agrocybe pediades]
MHTVSLSTFALARSTICSYYRPGDSACLRTCLLTAIISAFFIDVLAIFTCQRLCMQCYSHVKITQVRCYFIFDS